jgi:hypothetical protein
MSIVREIATKLETYAQEHRGSYWLLNVTGLDCDPPQGRIWIVADFPLDDLAAAVALAEFVCAEHRIPHDVTPAIDLNDEFREAVLPDSTQLGARPDKFSGLKDSYPELVRPDFEIQCGEGWTRLLEAFLTRVREFLPEGVGFELRQVRQKLGSLEIRWRTPLARESEAEREIAKAYALAVHRSLRTCERCGKPGVMRLSDVGRLFVACNDHGVDVDPAPLDEGNTFILSGVSYTYDPENDCLDDEDAMRRRTVNPYHLILEKADSEPVETIVIGSFTLQMLGMLGEKPVVAIPASKLGVVLSLEEARLLLDYEVGASARHATPPVTAWTQNWVIRIPADDGPIRAVRIRGIRSPADQ